MLVDKNPLFASGWIENVVTSIGKGRYRIRYRKLILLSTNILCRWIKRTCLTKNNLIDINLIFQDSWYRSYRQVPYDGASYVSTLSCSQVISVSRIDYLADNRQQSISSFCSEITKIWFLVWRTHLDRFSSSWLRSWLNQITIPVPSALRFWWMKFNAGNRITRRMCPVLTTATILLS